MVSCFCSDVGKTWKSKIVHDTHLPTIVTDLVEESLDLKCLDAVELHNVFAHCPNSLDKPTRSDLLDIRNAGRRRLVSYVRQYALCPPTEVPGKRSKQRLRTFTTRTSISREKAKVQKATRLLENAYAHVICSGVALAQTCPLPLAIATGKGEIRQRPKSSIRLAFVRDPVLAPIFATTCSFLTANQTEFDFVIDFLQVLHQPPPCQGVSLLEFCQYMWRQIVVKMGFLRGAGRVTNVIDKPEFLPSPRQLLHSVRQKKVGVESKSFYQFPSPSEKMPLGKEYACALATPDFKAGLTEFAAETFMQLAMEELHVGQSVLIDSPSFEQPLLLSPVGRCEKLPKNQKGEGDQGVWYHTCKSPFSAVIVFAHDTDIWMGGLALDELGYFSDRLVYVELRPNSEFVTISGISSVMKSHPNLQSLSHPAACLLAVTLSVVLTMSAHLLECHIILL